MAKEVRRVAAVNAAAIDEAIVCTAVAAMLLLLLMMLLEHVCSLAGSDEARKARDGHTRSEAASSGNGNNEEGQQTQLNAIVIQIDTLHCYLLSVVS